METEFKGMRYYDEKQLAWSLEVCPFDHAVDHERNMKKVWLLYNDAQKALSAYIEELIELQATLRVRMEKRVSAEDIATMYG